MTEAAQKLAPILKSRAAECEALGRLPGETVGDLIAAGLTKLTTPKDFGGEEVPWHVLCQNIVELAKGCAATAWVTAVYNEYNQRLANLSLEVQQEIWGENPNALLCSGNSPQATSTPVDGGFRLNGTFNFSSGCDHVDWHVLTARETESGAPRFHLVPKHERTIIEDWQVYGLAGTGSKSIQVSDVFVPAYRTLPTSDKTVHYSAPLYRLPQFSANGFVLGAVCIGAARGALDNFVQDMQERSSRFGSKIGDFQSLHLRVAESAAELDAAELVMLEDLKVSADYLQGNEALSQEIMAVNKRDMAFTAGLAVKAMDRLFYAAGAQGLFLDGSIQRSFRDVHAGASQLVLNWDVNGTVYGKLRLGLDLGPVRW